MSNRVLRDQLLTGFAYNYWFVCAECGTRIEVSAADYALQCTMRAPYPICRCGVEVDISAVSPTLRDTNDIASEGDSVDSLFWYHTSRYENWPDSEAYTADVTEQVAQVKGGYGFDGERYLRTKTSLALHLGTYESAIENMLRRLRGQDIGDPNRIRYWLHRVQIRLEPGDVDPHVGPEFASFMGDVALSDLQDRGARAVRYINVHEAAGAISLAIDRDVIVAVSTIELPVTLAAVAATPTANEAISTARRVLSEIERLRPDTTGIAAADLRLAVLSGEPRDPTDPESIRIHTLARQLDDYEDRWRAVCTELNDVLLSEYLPRANEQVRERFLDAVSHGDSPAKYHARFRMLASLIDRADSVISTFASAPPKILKSGDV
jgi:hypothetical protein